MQFNLTSFPLQLYGVVNIKEKPLFYANIIVTSGAKITPKIIKIGVLGRQCLAEKNAPSPCAVQREVSHSSKINLHPPATSRARFRPSSVSPAASC